MSLTMPNKKYFFDFLLLKIFTGNNITKELYAQLDTVSKDMNKLFIDEHWV